MSEQEYQPEPESQEPIEVEALVLAPNPALLSPVMSLQIAKDRLREFQQFVKKYLVKDEDFGTIPGTPKPTLYKAGADKLCELYGLADTYPEARIRRVEDWGKNPPLFDYEVTCVLIQKATGITVAEGMGSCNSYEARYRWRDAQRTCPECGKAAIIKGKAEYGGGWICFKKKDGCGYKYQENDERITSQAGGRVENDDVPTLKNTILKMAKKRAKIDATLSATRSSGLFTQDVEDLNGHAQTAQPMAADHISSVCSQCGFDIPTDKEVYESRKKFGKTLCKPCQKHAKPLDGELQNGQEKLAKEMGVPVTFDKKKGVEQFAHERGQR